MTQQERELPVVAGRGGTPVRRRGALGLVLLSMSSVQIGAAASLGMVDRLGVAGTTWLRLAWGALILVVVARPRLRGTPARELIAPVALGVVNAVMALAFFAAITRLPLGTTVAVEFLGPLGVAAARSRSWRGAGHAGLALAGVLVLTTPWAQSPSDRIGMLLAATAALGWAAYILLTTRVGSRWSGLSGLAVALPVAAAVSAPLGVAQVWGRLTALDLVACAGLAVLLPVLPYGAEMAALRRLPQRVFGVWMSLEPAIGVAVGLALLGQAPGLGQVGGVLLVVLASVAAARSER